MTANSPDYFRVGGQYTIFPKPDKEGFDSFLVGLVRAKNRVSKESDLGKPTDTPVDPERFGWGVPIRAVNMQGEFVVEKRDPRDEPLGKRCDFCISYPRSQCCGNYKPR